MLIDRQIEEDAGRLLSVEKAARVLGWTSSAMRAKVFRGHVRVVRVGGRIYVPDHELERLSGRTA